VITKEENERGKEQRETLHLQVLGQLQHEGRHYGRNEAAAAAKSRDTRHAGVKVMGSCGKSCQVVVISRQARGSGRGGLENLAHSRCYERDDT
jgi:hypothetical protein